MIQWLSYRIAYGSYRVILPNICNYLRKFWFVFRSRSWTFRRKRLPNRSIPLQRKQQYVFWKQMKVESIRVLHSLQCYPQKRRRIVAVVKTRQFKPRVILNSLSFPGLITSKDFMQFLQDTGGLSKCVFLGWVSIQYQDYSTVSRSCQLFIVNH